MNRIELREMTPDDYPQLYAMAEMLRAESPTYAVEPHSQERYESITGAITGGFLKAFAALDGDALVGFAIGFVAPNTFVAVTEVFDLVIYVRPDYRRSSIAPDLINKLADWGKEMGARAALFAISTNINLDKTVALYESQGFVKQPTVTLRKEL